MAITTRHCMKCKRKLYEGEGLADGICGDCGLAAMFGGMPDVLSIEKESGEHLTKEMIERARQDKHEHTK